MLKWLRAIGFYRGFLLVSFIPTSLGAVLAWWQGNTIAWPWLVGSLIGVWLLHAGANLLNDYYDHVSGTDDINEVQTPFSGGTRVIQDGLIPAGQIRAAGYTAYALGMTLFAVLSLRLGWELWALALCGLFCGWAYTARPVWLSYRGFGELLIAINFGPALVLTGHYAVSRTLNPSAAWVGVAFGCWAAAIVTINQLPDLVADAAVGKRNLVVRRGPVFGLRLWATLLYVALATLTAGIFLGVLPPAMVIGLLVLPLVVRLVDGGASALDSLEANIAACGRTIRYEMAFWALLVGGLLASGLLGIGR